VVPFSDTGFQPVLATIGVGELWFQTFGTLSTGWKPVSRDARCRLDFNPANLQLQFTVPRVVNTSPGR
jgi:hypothetical protein